MRFRYLITLAAVLPSVAAAVLFDDLADLEGKTVIYAGEFERLECPIGGKYDCLKWPRNLLRTKGVREICLAPAPYASCLYNCKGVIAVGGDKTPYIFMIDGLGSDFKKARFETFDCPAIF